MKPFRLFTFAVLAAAIVPRLAHRGMFVDGVTYASIARNLAEGRGSFWSPSYTATVYPQFHMHPALGLWLQSLWFRALGDHMVVERAYAITVALATAFLIGAIWRRLHEGNENPSSARQFEWLPILSWIAVPVVSWSIVGNMLETTVTCFIAGSVAALVEAAWARPTAAFVAWGGLSGLCIIAAALTKGPVALFALAAPLLVPVTSDRRGRSLLAAAQWTTAGICALGVLSVPEARASLLQYLNEQLLPALDGRYDSDSLKIVKVMLEGVWLPMIVGAVLIVAAARELVVPSKGEQRQAMSFLLLGLAGTLPILASRKQMGHYLVPAVPFFAMATASFIAPTVARLVGRIVVNRQAGAISATAVFIIFGTITASFVPALDRDRQRLADLDALEPMAPRGVTVGICYAASGDWGLHAWFERRFHVSLDTALGSRRDWFLQTAPPAAGCPPATCAPATDPSRQLILLKCRRP